MKISSTSRRPISSPNSQGSWRGARDDRPDPLEGKSTAGLPREGEAADMARAGIAPSVFAPKPRPDEVRHPQQGDRREKLDQRGKRRPPGVLEGAGHGVAHNRRAVSGIPLLLNSLLSPSRNGTGPWVSRGCSAGVCPLLANRAAAMKEKRKGAGAKPGAL